MFSNYIKTTLQMPKGVKGFPKENTVGNRFTTENQPETNGRIEGVKNRSTIARKWLSTVTNWKNPLTGEFENLTLEDQITLAQIKAARDNEVAISYKVLMDSAHGSVQQKVDVTSGDKSISTSPIINIFNQAPPMATNEKDVDEINEGDNV